MKRTYSLSGWLIANLIMLSISMLMTWLILGFEPPPALTSVSGWEFIFMRIATPVELLLEYDFAWLWILSFLQGVGGIFVMGYVVFKITSIAKLESHEGSKILAVVLGIVAVIFLFHGLLYELNLPLPGYWLFILGLLSSAIFEWRNSMTNR